MDEKGAQESQMDFYAQHVQKTIAAFMTYEDHVQVVLLSPW